MPRRDDKLVLEGLARVKAQQTWGRVPTAAELGAARGEVAPRDLDNVPSDERARLMEVGRGDATPFLVRLRALCQTLQRRLTGWAGTRVLVEVLACVDELELALIHRKPGGRPRGKRHKVKAEHLEAVRQWMEGGGGGSVSALAKSLGLSRQTVYTLIQQISEGRRDG
jgi:hypothetical protein